MGGGGGDRVQFLSPSHAITNVSLNVLITSSNSRFVSWPLC